MTDRDRIQGYFEAFDVNYALIDNPEDTVSYLVTGDRTFTFNYSGEVIRVFNSGIELRATKPKSDRVLIRFPE